MNDGNDAMPQPDQSESVAHEWENDGWCQNGVREYFKCVRCGVGYREDEPEPAGPCEVAFDEEDRDAH